MMVTLSSPGIMIRDPDTLVPIQFGEVVSVPNSTFYLRRIADGSLTEHKKSQPKKSKRIK